MERREEMVMLAEEAEHGKNASGLSDASGNSAREPQGKQSLLHRGCLSPGAAAAAAVPYSRDRSDLLVVEENGRRNMCAADGRPLGASSTGERHRSDHPLKDGSSSDTESDFYEEIDVSCTPEGMDYTSGKGRRVHVREAVFKLQVIVIFLGRKNIWMVLEWGYTQRRTQPL